MKKFTQLGKPFQSGISGLWYVPAEKIDGHYLTILGDVELMNPPISGNTDKYAFDTEQKAILVARNYYTYHGFLYPCTFSEEVEKLLDTQSQIMEFA